MDKKFLISATFCILVFANVCTMEPEPASGLIVSEIPYSFWFFNDPGQLHSFSGMPELNKQAQGAFKMSTYEFSYFDTRVTSLAADTRNQSLYYIDSDRQAMFRLDHANVSLSQSAIKETKIHDGISSSLGSVVFDWISRNLYWTDRYHNFIGCRPADTNDSLMYRVVLEQQIIVPVALAIDPKLGYLFWSDTMPSPRIQRSNLLGHERTVIQYDGIKFPSAMVADNRDKKIYWVDFLRDKVEWSDYQGGRNNRGTLKHYNGMNLYGITSFGDFICVTEDYYKELICLDKMNKTEKWKTDVYKAGGPHAVTTYDKYTQPAEENACLTKKCGHFCVRLPPNQANCVCKEGYRLLGDGVTCEASHVLDKKGLLFTNGSHICIFDIHAITSAKHIPQCIDYPLNNTQFLQVDTEKGLIFFWNSSEREIKKFNTVTKTISAVAPTSTFVTGMFYDWLEDTIFWSEKDTGTIKRAHQSRGDFKVVYSGIINPAYIVGNPHNQTLYWISGSGSSAIIEGGPIYKQSRFTVLPSTKVTNPSHLYYDEIYEGLFWVNDEEVKTVKTDGSELESRMSVGKVTSFLVYKDYVVWTDGEDNIKVEFVLGTGPKIISLTKHNSIKGVCVTDPRLQRPQRGPCEDGNGGCQHICIPTPTGRVCQCPLGLKIANDSKGCTSTPLTNNFALVTDAQHHRIYQIPTTGQFRKEDIVAIDLPSVDQPHAAVYHESSGYLYWGEINNQRIKRIKLDGKNETVVWKFVNHFPDRLVFDNSTGNLYFTAYRINSSTDSYIGALHLDPVLPRPKHRVVRDNLRHPRSLALFPSKGFMFWSEASTGSLGKYIGRANMDGTKSKTLISSDTMIVIGMTIDYLAERIYWAEYYKDKIMSATLDGEDVRTFFELKNTRPSGLDLSGSFIYMIGWNHRYISKINLNTGKVVPWMTEVHELGRLDSIQVYPPEPQPVSKQCSVSGSIRGCSTFCFPREDSAICGCEDDVKMRDTRHCENVCFDYFEHVRISRSCVIRPGGSCTYRCTGHLKKNKDIDQIKCFLNGTWDKSEKTLCNEMVCPDTVPDVRLIRPCSKTIGKTCNYTCNDPTRRKMYTLMRCSSGGIWVPNTNLCQVPLTLKCPAVIKNGRLGNGCSRLANNTECGFTCDEGMVSAGNMKTLVCHSDGQWTYDVDKLCIQITVSPEAQTAEQQAITIGAGLGVVIIILFIFIVAAMVCFLRRREAEKNAEVGRQQNGRNIPRQEIQSGPPFSEFTNQEKAPEEPAGGAYVSIGKQSQPSPQKYPETKPETKPETYSQQPKHATFINIGKGGSNYERF